MLLNIGYDLNGNQTALNVYGGAYGFTYDDEDRLTSLTLPGGGTNTFTYNGLGLRVGKVDSTGTYIYICDGTTPGSPVLSDAHAVYTPGLPLTAFTLETIITADNFVRPLGVPSRLSFW